MSPKELCALMALAMLAVGAAPAMAQLADGIVINEAEINPPGEDSKTISEWVELYNPTSNTVELGRWSIDSAGFRDPLYIDPGVIIGPGEFKAFLHETLWFPNTGTVITLYDSAGDVVDMTPPLTDEDNDASSWQRIRDGYGTDDPADWKFGAPSIETHNSKQEVQTVEDELVVNVSTDKAQYTFGQYATISGNVSEIISVAKPSFGVESIEISVSGFGYSRQLSLYPDAQLNFETQLRLQKVLGVLGGTYTVHVEYAGTTASTEFSVGTITKTHSEIEQGTFSITTDSDSYLPGQEVKVSGKTSKIVQLEGLKFELSDIFGNVHFKGTLYPDESGAFSTDVQLRQIRPIYGTYTLSAAYAGMEASSTFKLEREDIAQTPISLSSDRDAYEPGQTAHITGRLNHIWISSVDVEVRQLTSDAPSPECRSAIICDPPSLAESFGVARLAGDRTFSYEFLIVNDTASYGEYRAKISEDVGIAEIFFKVVPNPDSYNGTAGGAPLVVSTDRERYAQWDSFEITGKINDILSSTTFKKNLVEIRILKSDGSALESQLKLYPKVELPIVYSLTAIPDSAGNFEAKDTLPALSYEPGFYTVEATYAAGNQKAYAVFEVVDPLDIGTNYLVRLDRNVLGFGETLNVEGVIPGNAQGTGIIIKLFKPDGDTDEFAALTDNSRFTWSWRTPLGEKETGQSERGTIASNYGVYRISFDTGSHVINEFFKVSPNPENDRLEVPPIIVSTDRPVYSSGDDITIYGAAQKRVAGQSGIILDDRVRIGIKDPANSLQDIYTTFLYLDQGGGYEANLNLPVTIFKEGTYKVTAHYNNRRATTTFDVDSEFLYSSNAPLSLELNTDKDSYLPGQTARITGGLNKIVNLDRVDLTIRNDNLAKRVCAGLDTCSSAEIKTTLVPGGAGTFVYEHDVGMDEGTYTVYARADFGTFETSFDVAIPEPEPFRPISMVEKFNRITDSEVMIPTVPVTINGTKFVPRVLQGSLFTPERDAESTVNLMVLAGGACVIGPECPISESTRSASGIFAPIIIDGKEYKVRYTGPDAKLEKFAISPAGEGAMNVQEWEVRILKENQSSLFYYKITRISQE